MSTTTNTSLSSVNNNNKEEEQPSNEKAVVVETIASSSLCATEQESCYNEDGEEEDDDDYFADVGFMFERCQPTKLETFTYKSSKKNSSSVIKVAMHVADEEPGSIQSGHYLWPGAKYLAKYLVDLYHNNNGDTPLPLIKSMVELGAGCALVSLTSLQIFHETLQLLIVTDHDPGTLARARDNLETTLQSILDDSITDIDNNNNNDTNNNEEHKDDTNTNNIFLDDEILNTTINNIASIPVLFESLEWGNNKQLQDLYKLHIQEHLLSTSMKNIHNNKKKKKKTIPIDLVIGSDLIYSIDTIQPLLETASQLIRGSGNITAKSTTKTGRFILSQSFVIQDPTYEDEIIRVCDMLNLQRNILKVQQKDGDNNEEYVIIQEFVPINIQSSIIDDDNSESKETVEGMLSDSSVSTSLTL